MELKRPADPDDMTDFEKKHTPVIEISGDKIVVKVGDGIVHPMQEDHYIQYIELFKDGESIAKKEFKPGEKPEAEFEDVPLGDIKAQELCNLHGLWESL